MLILGSEAICILNIIVPWLFKPSNQIAQFAVKIFIPTS